LAAVPGAVRRHRQALERRIALVVLPDQPAHRDRMDHQQPVEPGLADRLAGAREPRGKLFLREIMLRHRMLPSTVQAGSASVPERRTSLSISPQTVDLSAPYSGENCTERRRGVGSVFGITALTRPGRADITNSRDDRMSASSIECVMNTMVLPLRSW